MISLYDLINVANGQLFGEPAAQVFTNFTLDPEQVDASLLFVVLPIEHGDTEATMCRAIKNGVGGVVCIDPPTCDATGVSIIMVPDPIDALLAWAKFVLERNKVKVIAVAGSDGKSTTVQAITAILGARYNVHAGDTEHQGRLSLPLSLATLTSEHEFVVMKYAVQHPGDMAALVGHLRPQVAVGLSVDCIHTDDYHSCDEFVEEQRHVFTSLPEDGLAVANFDDDLMMQVVNDIGAPLATIAVDRFGADLIAFNVVAGGRRTGFDLRADGERYVARWTPLLGKYHLYSALASLAVGRHFDVPLEEGLRALTGVQPLSGRMNPLLGLQGSLLIDDTYRATTTSAIASLELLESLRVSYKRRFFILGDMDDLGTQAIRGHRLVGQKVADVADIFITQGTYASAAARAAIDAGMPVEAIHTTYSTQDAVTALLQYQLTSEDVVIVKGGDATHMQKTVAALLDNPDDVTKLVRQVSDARDLRQDFRPLRPSWLEIRPQVIAKNMQTLVSLAPENTSVMAVVKANGYGHGAVIIARTALQNGATYLAVANLAEALELRDAGIKAPILILSYTPLSAVRLAVQHDLTITIYDLEMARQYNRLVRDIDGTLKYHIKVDSGMGRFGIMPDDVVYIFRHLVALKHLELEGIYTHFSVADSDESYTKTQLETFRELLRPLRASGIKFKHIHAANSPALLYRDETEFNTVRAGLALYGMNPALQEAMPPGLQTALAWKTSVLQVKTLPPGHPVGYGNTYRTRTDETIAILPVGYADGFRRAPRTWRHVLIHGEKAPVLGRVSMEKIAVDVSRIEDVAVGDEVVLIGRQDNAEITVDDVANWLGTINYEVVTTLNQNIPRVIIND
jgi:alanine racemase